MKLHDYSASHPNQTAGTKAYLEPSEVESLEKCTSNLRDRLLVRLLFHLGCRVSEALALQIQDIDFNNGTVVIQHLKVQHQTFLPYVWSKAWGESCLLP